MLRSKLLRKPLHIVVASVVAVSGLIPALLTQSAYAYNTLSNRAVEMSSSAVSATSTSYKISFRAYATTTVKSIAVDFCSNSPIIGDSCTAPTGFTVGTPSVTIGTNMTATWTAASLNSGRTLTLTKAAGDSIPNSSDTDFTLTTATNPSTTGTFYARIFTYPNDTSSNSAANYTAGTVGTAGDQPTDAGGVAMSTAQQITITAKVQERLTFCVYGNDATGYANNNCTSKSSTGAIILGDTNGVLDPAGVYTNKKARYTVSTNASGSVAIRMKGTTLTSGSNTVSAIGGGTAEASSSPGSEQFGLCTYQSAGSGLTPDAGYDGASGAPAAECSGTTDTSGTGTPGGDNSALFAFNTSGTGSTYGSAIASKAAGDFSTGTLVFMGNISNTTEAGIYTTTLTFIATGTY